MMSLFILVVSLAYLQVSSACTLEYDPVCLKTGGTSTLYSNDCYMREEYNRLIAMGMSDIKYCSGLCVTPICDKRYTFQEAAIAYQYENIIINQNSLCVNYTDGEYQVQENEYQLNLYLCARLDKVVQVLTRCNSKPTI